MAIVNSQLNTKVKTGVVRFSYVHVFEPTAFDESQEPKYSVMLLIDKKDKETTDAINTAYKNAVAQGVSRFGEGFKKRVNDLLCKPGDTKGLIRDGDTDPRYEDDPETYGGKYVLNCKCKSAPGVIAIETGMQRLTLENGGPESFYSGCYGKATFNLYPFSKAGNIGVAVGLNNLLKTRDGENLGGKVSAESDLGAELSDSSNYDEDGLIG